jgi:hypothetical protein
MTHDDATDDDGGEAMRPMVTAAAAALAGAAPAVSAAPEAAPATAPAQEQAEASEVFLPFNKGVTIPVSVDPTLVRAVHDHYVEVYGMAGYVVTLLDTYESNPALGNKCKGGQERFLRVLNTATKREAWHMQVASCAKGITSADPVLTWDESNDGFTVHMTSGPEVKVKLSPAGEVKVVG